MQWMQDHAWLGEEEEVTETHKAVVKTGVSTFARFVYGAGEAFGAGLAAIKGTFEAR
jgi:hypothetical protein